MADGLLLDLGENNNTPVATTEGSAPATLAFIEDPVTTPESTTSPLDAIVAKPLEFISREETQTADAPEQIPPVETPSAGVSEPEKPVANGTHPLESTPSTPAEDTTVSNKEDAKDEEKPKEPLDPRLKEIEEKFGGKWKMVRSDPYDEYLKSLGVGYFSRKVAGRAYHDMEVTIQEDNTIAVAMRSFLHSQSYVWKLDEEVENVVEKSKQSVVCTYENGKLVQQMTPLDPNSNKMQQVERSINDIGEHEVIFTAGEAICRRYYARIPDPNAAKAAEQTPPKEASTEEKEKAAEEKSKPTEQQDKPTEQKEEITEPVKDEIVELVNEVIPETVADQPAGQTEPTEQSSQPAGDTEDRPDTPSSSSC